MKMSLKMVKNLQNLFNLYGVDAYIIPRSNMFQTETVRPWEEKLAWISGFQGSAGFAVIAQDNASLFVDGRYTLQAQKEKDPIFEVNPLNIEAFKSWLLDKKVKRLGFDPWLHSIEEIERWRQNFSFLELVPISENLIDEIWVDHPTPIEDEVFLHPISFSGVSYAEKCSRILEFSQKTIFIGSCETVSWLFNIRSKAIPHIPVVPGFSLLKSSGESFIFLDHAYPSEEVRKALPQTTWLNQSELLSFLSAYKEELSYDPRQTPFALLGFFEKGIAKPNPCVLFQACKNPAEILGARSVHEEEGRMLSQILTHIKTTSGLSELDVVDLIEQKRSLIPDYQGPSFSTIAGYGSNGAIVHYRPKLESNKKIEKDGLFLLDTGGQYLRGTTDMTRTIAIGTPTQEQKDRFTRVLKGHIAIASLVFPAGTTGGQIDILARQHLWQIFQDYAHGTGHGVGSFLSVHEGPQGISPRSFSVALQSGMILSNEPGFYKEGEYGIRLENLVLVVPCDQKGWLKFGTLTNIPFDEDLVDDSLLAPEERKWLTSYQERAKKI